ncbi:flagellar motor switch protein FliG [Desulfatirhabdium butyrativorans]|uniref:flagellar motor switch protein FliG n=1 Tax=Desulfatirhabdium butyrativorans TaxID=340467 RepID=UPI0003F73DBF|nr:flagellar motor switch protein FliG [Desulfatirhabdium butyrativorans]
MKSEADIQEIDSKNLTGPMKVAILIYSLGADAARALVSGLDARERAVLQKHLKLVEKLPPKVIEQVAAEFIALVEKSQNAVAQIQEALNEDFPQLPAIEDLSDQKEKDGKKQQQQASGDQRQQPTDEKDAEHKDEEEDEEFSLKTLQKIDPEQLAEMIRDEHPQTIAIIVVHLKPESGSEVLARLPDSVKVEVAMRIARLDKVLSGMVVEIDKVFEEVLKKKKKTVTRKTGGIAHLAELLNMVEGTTTEMILNEIEESNPELAAQIKQMMFVFEDLVMVNDKGLQKVLRRVETAKLALALKGASEDVRKKIFKNMSERAGAILKEEIESIGAVRMKDVEEAQLTITKIIQELETKGELIIAGRKGGEMIT